MSIKLNINDRFLLSYIDFKNKDTKKIDSFLLKYKKNNAIFIEAKEYEGEINYNITFYYNKKFINLKSISINNYNYPFIFTKLKKVILNQWKTDNLLQNLNIYNIKCEVNYYNFLELKQIKMNMNNVSIFNNIHLNSISYKKNIYSIDYYGNKEALPKLFNLNGLKIQNQNSECKIYLK